MTPLALAWRTTRTYRARAVLAIIGVAVIGALLFDMLLLSRGLLLSFSDLLASARYDVRILGSEGLPSFRLPVPHADRLAAEVQELPEIERVAVIRTATASIGSGTKPSREATLIGTTDAGGAGAWTVLRGASLADRTADPCPLVIDAALAADMRLEPGAPVQIEAQLRGVASALPPVPCRVIAVASFAFGSSDDYTIATTMAAYRHATGDAPESDANIVLAASRPPADAAAAARAIQRLRPDLHVYSNPEVLAQFNRNGFAYFRQISFVLSSLTMVFAFLLVATLLTVSINQRLGEIAALRALGIGRRRIAAMLLWESALLVGAGGLLALPVGGALAVWLDGLLRKMPGLPDRLHFFVFEPRALLIHLGLLAVTAIAAAGYPIWLTARLPIAPTLRREVVG